jgi:aldehyde:ferredoxin oxidoreductase
MLKGWTGKRLRIDLTLQRSWSEEFSPQDLISRIGGRAINAAFFLEAVPLSMIPSSPEYPLAFAVGPLTGTFAPCSGWTSISGFSPLAPPPGYFHASMPGHWGAQLKFSGFDQCVIQGRSERPVTISIHGEKVRFEDARSLSGKDTIETTISVQEQMGDRTTEVLCIGPAGEKLVPLSNLVNRFSWTADHVGAGYAFGVKNLKAIAIHGERPVLTEDSPRFLDFCTALRGRIQMDRHASGLREKGTFYLLGNNGGGLGIRNFREASTRDMEEAWGGLYAKRYLYGREGCFSCPIHCGRITQVEGNFFGGVHLEGAWSLGPRIGVTDWEATLRLYRVCQKEGIDPSAVGSLSAWLMDCCEKGVLTERELGQFRFAWGNEEAVTRIIEQVLRGTGEGEILRNGSLRAAEKFGRGSDLVAHAAGMDIPVRDPRSSMEYALGVGLFPSEWDYLASMTPEGLPSRPGPAAAGPCDSGFGEEKRAAARTARSEDLKALSDLACLCPLLVSRLELITPADIAEMTSAATGIEQDPQAMLSAARKTLRIEQLLSERNVDDQKKPDALSERFFTEPSSGGEPLDRDRWEGAISL